MVWFCTAEGHRDTGGLGGAEVAGITSQGAGVIGIHWEFAFWLTGNQVSMLGRE